MPLVFPLNLANFFSGLKIVDMSLNLGENVTHMETGGGELRPAEHGTRLWEGTVKTRMLPHVSAEDAMAQLRIIMGARASFYVEPIHNRLNIANPTIGGVQNGYEVFFNGLPANYALRRGAMFAYNYDNGRRAFHQVVEAVSANASGVTPYFTVEPAIQPGWTVGQAVTFAGPSCKARYVPRSLQVPTIRAVLMDGPSFGWKQTLEK